LVVKDQLNVTAGDYYHWVYANNALQCNFFMTQLNANETNQSNATNDYTNGTTSNVSLVYTDVRIGMGMDGGWMEDGRWEMGDGRWEMGDGSGLRAQGCSQSFCGFLIIYVDTPYFNISPLAGRSCFVSLPWRHAQRYSSFYHSTNSNAFTQSTRCIYLYIPQP
jgi:hypothetical protein